MEAWGLCKTRNGASSGRRTGHESSRAPAAPQAAAVRPGGGLVLVGLGGNNRCLAVRDHASRTAYGRHLSFAAPRELALCAGGVAGSSRRANSGCSALGAASLCPLVVLA